MKIAWVTDSTVNLDESIVNHPDIYSIPMVIMFNNEEYRDGIDLSVEEFFVKLESSPKLPTSSQPAVGAFVELYESLTDRYDVIISVHLSSKLSGTYATSVQAANMVDFPIHIIDSKLLSLPMGKMIEHGINMQNSGSSVEEIVSALNFIADQHETYVMIGSLEQLHKGGRMSGAQFLIGSALKIKPILALVDGALEPREKIRTEKKAEQRMIDLFNEAKQANPDIDEVNLLYGRYPDVANDWKQILSEQYPDVKVHTCPLGPVIGVHAGAKTFGISWLRQKK
ncbi:DegV family protein [Bacillus suaedaesalsae]|uniref:DegV family protein n=1 Tax=Bacillus suaedaesalsae TaxID=2810349 RepID=A0ABS2DLG7_9BACI|nr:DegV family protein [Bacillus suaedaesalsae]MBM6619340.1 DegV family protein [Bacillus suaedaesalsae]